MMQGEFKLLCILLFTCCLTVCGQSTGSCPSVANIANCNDCWNPELECVVCQDRWWWKNLQTCIKCPDHCASCKDSNGDDKTECTDCDDFYFKTADEQCKACSGHCKGCSSEWSCDACGDAYRLEDVNPISCLDCSQGCAHCLDFDANACLDCVRGYYYTPYNSDHGRCTACGSRCEECTSGTTCDKCEPGTTWTGTSCTPCIVNCDMAFCSTTAGCTQCIPGYSLTAAADQCRTCAHCADCLLVGGCLHCEPGYILLDDGTCQICPNIDGDAQTCAMCSASDRARVYLSQQCLYCPLNCKSCASVDTCSECYDGFYLQDNECKACDANCVKCTTSASNCIDACADGFGLVSGKCEACPTATGTPQCKLCVGSNCICDDNCECNDGHFQVETSSTAQHRCRTCTDYEAIDSAKSCVQCAPANKGRYMSTDKCVGCDTFGQCLKCTTAACTLCADGYYYDSTDKMCKTCTAASCKVCRSSNPSYCDECNTNKWSDQGTCKACVAGCDKCLNSFQCVTCNSGFFPEHTTVCPKCTVDHCKTCDPLGTCSACLPGYHGTTSCTACTDRNCIACATDRSMCTACKTGYSLLNSQCVDCGVNKCAVCDENVGLRLTPTDFRRNKNCDTCEDGTYLAGTKKCFALDDAHCLVNTGNYGNCDICMSGYGKLTTTTGVVCQPCHSSCTECTVADDASKCTKCVDPLHALVESTSGVGTCTACDSSCMTCAAAGANKCKTCTDTTQFGTSDGATCAACDTSCATCSAAAATDCTSCASGKGLLKSTGACVDVVTTGCTDVNCMECEDGTPDKCTVCEPGYSQTSSDTCVACPSRCKVLCTAANTCPTGGCEDGFGGDACDVVCHQSCKTCTMSGANKCSSCHDGVGFSSTDTTCTCAVECATCKADDGTKCLSCKPGYGLQASDDTCTQFPTFASCSVGTAAECTQCIDRYGLFIEDACNACGTNCKTCSSSTICSVCVDGYFLTTSVLSGTCGDEKCVTHCKVCATASSCTTCDDGYILQTATDGATTCVPCNSNCKACDVTALHECTTCEDGHLRQPVCSACSTHCDVCDAEKCTKCNPRYYLNSMNQCTACTDTNCLTCPLDRCATCAEDYKLDSQNACVGISTTGYSFTNCKDVNNEVCTLCDDNYYLDPTTKLCVECNSDSSKQAKYSCLQCAGKTGHNTNQDWLGTCTDCPDNCVTCSATGCTKCLDGMYTDGTVCLPLSCTLSSISHENACIACSTTNYNSNDEHRGLVYEAGQCKECPRNCKRCTSTSTCAECPASYIFNSAEQACVECNFNDETKCNGCVASSGTTGRYFNSDGVCLLCNQFCTSCTGSASKCTSCASTHYLNEETSTCHACSGADVTQPGCVSCQETYSAWTDNVHAWLQQPAVNGADPVSTCDACPSSCASCSEKNTCSECFPARYFFSDEETSTYECRSCMSNCASCTAADSCTLCSTGYFYKSILSANSCEVCPNDCTECTHSDGCTECRDGYYLDADNTCKSCNVVPNCERCALIGEAVQCMLCDATFYPKELNGLQAAECAGCADNCARCSSDVGCDECLATFCYDETESVCRATNGRQCDACELRDNTVSCLTCYDTTYLDLCQSCDDSRCTVCAERDDICTECTEGSYLTANDDCSTCPAGCISCIDGNSCTTCRDATYWDVVAVACLPCLSQCAECRDGDKCETCVYENTYKDTTSTPNSCNLCLTGCYNCTSDLICTTCYPGFYPTHDDNDNVIACNACGTGCSKCSLASDGVAVVCEVCSDGYALVAGICQACSSFSNCIDCLDVNNNDVIDDGDCAACAPGTVMADDNAQCLGCTIAGCTECQDRGYVCEDCSGTNLPSIDQYTCGSPCWFCESEEECAMAPVLNGTSPMPGSAYMSVGCTNGCSVTRNETSDGIVYHRACLPEALDCEYYSEEQCMNYGEDSEKIIECILCCRGELCNVQELTGQSAGAERIFGGVVVMLAAYFAHLIISLM